MRVAQAFVRKGGVVYEYSMHVLDVADPYPLSVSVNAVDRPRPPYGRSAGTPPLGRVQL
jgi:hypothetical protein